MFTIGKDELIHVNKETMEKLCNMYDELDKLFLLPNELDNLRCALIDVIEVCCVEGDNNNN